MTSQDLLLRIQELEQELAREREKTTSVLGVTRAKIDVMSSEVLDSNPYRCVGFFFFLPCVLIGLTALLVKSPNGTEADGNSGKLRSELSRSESGMRNLLSPLRPEDPRGDSRSRRRRRRGVSDGGDADSMRRREAAAL